MLTMTKTMKTSGPILAYAAPGPNEPLEPFEYDPAPLGPFDVELEISHCGICHSDLHLIDNDWPVASYPLVAGHEIVGYIRSCGEEVAAVERGQRVGVGWQCGSCLDCEWCLRGLENCCAERERTCVGRHGGFAHRIRLDSRFVFPIPDALSSESAAPLFCAGLTVFSPLRRLAAPTAHVGVLGIGGLGHLALQFASAMGCAVTALSHSPKKREEARVLGADHFIDIGDEDAFERMERSLDLILSTTTAKLNWRRYLRLLRPMGELVFIGGSSGALDIPGGALISGQRRLSGSAIGGRATMRQMLAFAVRHGIAPVTETAPIAEINDALDRVRAGEVRYRMVLEIGERSKEEKM